MGRVISYGIGKTLVTLRMDELPSDIQEGIICRYRERAGPSRVTGDTEEIVLVCEDIVPRKRDGK